MATTTEKIEMSDIDYARWFLTLRLFSDDFNVDFLQSVVNTEEPTEKQLVGLNKCVVGLKLREKIGKYDISKHECFFNEEIDFEDIDTRITENEKLYCSATKKSIRDDDELIMNTDTKRFIKVSEFKKQFLIKKPKKKLVKL